MRTLAVVAMFLVGVVMSQRGPGGGGRRFPQGGPGKIIFYLFCSLDGVTLTLLLLSL